MCRKAIVNGCVVLENRILWDGVVLIRDGIITDVGRSKDVEVPQDTQCIDAKGAYVGPGFVDIHVHGGDGYNTWEEPEKAGAFFLKHGTTSFLATPSGARGFDEMIAGLKRLNDAMGRVKNLKGIFMEGPYFNTEYGANSHKNPWKGPIDPAQYKALVDTAGKNVRTWMIAPERPGILEFMQYAKQVNPDLIFTMGHSEATPEQIQKLGSMRPMIMTHVLNATGRLDDRRGVKGNGPDEYCFTHPEMYAELISDSEAVHVKPTNQQLVLRVKGFERVILITDSTAYNNPAPERLAHIPDLNFDDRGGLAGSKLTMEKACRNVMGSTGCGICQAFLMAATNPARAVGLQDVGSVEIGKKADLVIVDDRFNIQQVLLTGEPCPL